MSGPNYVIDKGYLVDPLATGVDFGLGVMFADTAGKVVELPSGPTVFCVGVAQETIDDDKIATGNAVVNVRVLGITRAVAGEALTVGQQVEVRATGKFHPAVAASRVVGVVMSPASALDAHFNLLLTHAGIL